MCYNGYNGGLMKDFIKFFSIITGLFRSIISILLLFSIGFVVFVDNHLFLATIDLLGINNISSALVKPLALVVFILSFVINTAITRSIFKAGENGNGHLANVFFGLVFLGLDAFLYFYFRDSLIFIILGLNGLVVLNSLVGLIARFRGVYNTGIAETKTEYIEVKTNSNDKDSADSPIKLTFNDDKDDVNILKKDVTEVDGETVIRTSQLIKEDTELESLSKDETTKDDESPINLNDKEKESKNINRIVEDSGEGDLTYDPDLAEDFKKKEEAKVYTKDNFVKKED